MTATRPRRSNPLSVISVIRDTRCEIVDLSSRRSEAPVGIYLHEFVADHMGVGGDPDSRWRDWGMTPPHRRLPGNPSPPAPAGDLHDTRRRASSRRPVAS